jgi:hypothetical protein
LSTSNRGVVCTKPVWPVWETGLGNRLDRFWQQWHLKCISSAIKLLQQASRSKRSKWAKTRARHHQERLKAVFATLVGQWDMRVTSVQMVTFLSQNLSIMHSLDLGMTRMIFMLLEWLVHLKLA